LIKELKLREAKVKRSHCRDTMFSGFVFTLFTTLPYMVSRVLLARNQEVELGSDTTNASRV
jgi:hypothetical protein